MSRKTPSWWRCRQRVDAEEVEEQDEHRDDREDEQDAAATERTLPGGALSIQQRSIIVAIPCPTPMHIVQSAYRPPLFC
ncbi:MAG TPA: hypothetical protein VMJ13_08040, partial [Candidatus Acidoferrum sp.]|nr:hypothetical protein [Candidatus Acidoferrum sp.]